jgi:hypothetical protein
MFGKDDDQPQTQAPVQAGDDPLQAAMPDPIADGNLGDLAAQFPAMDAVANAPSLPADPTPANEPDLSAPELPATGTADPVAPQPDQLDDTPPDAPAAGPSAAADADLVSLKQQALQQLSPLVSQLDQTPEEKFRTTMMMIQASDDKSLIRSAFEAATQITDDKARAQALLDVINEINYFSQQHPS